MKQGKYLFTIAAIAIMAFGSAGPAAAADRDSGDEARTGLFFGYSLGYAHRDSDDDYAWGLNAFFRFHEYAAIQTGYLDSGKAPGEGPVDGLHVSAMPMVPIPGSPVTAFGTVGLAVFDGDDDLTYGAGLMYDLPLDVISWADGGFSVRGEWMHIGLEGGDADAVLAGLYYRFGKY